MFVFTLLVSRLVPVLLGLSLFLVLGRFWHDRFAERSRPLARGIFTAVLGLGAVILLPYVVRSNQLIAAETAFQGKRWADASRRFAAYRSSGGRTTESLNLDWASSLINIRLWREAEGVLLSGVRRTSRSVNAYPRTILLLGISRYYQGQFGESEKTLRAVCGESNETVCFYFLGRTAERRGDARGSVEAFRRSLRHSPQFFPSVYHLVRLSMEAGDQAGARDVLQRFVRAGGGPQGPDIAALDRAIGDGRRLPDREFYLIQN